MELSSYLLGCLLSIQKSSILTKHIKPNDCVDKAVRYIEYNYMNHITTKDISDYLILDRTYFYRIFKRYTGTSPQQYIMNYRIKKSLELITSGKYKVGEVASYIGINDVYYFSKLFKKIMGIRRK